ncbi:THUMP domain-containing class I SAM-dependent RNA methyltransferase [Shimia abyssi]|uniref:Putative N6-adenine-specific DNA methylase n=1 Tax=Shimia abyssi TaxID=1662395 RepID=A0A2P8FHU7_9RHOB|nr:RNA methyltransferase [Shimia abyssi]PSL21277.1 putative N6-adenine-specific DNA methylase [Shimia abyssi]
MKKFEIFLITSPGLEKALVEEVREAGFAKPKMMPGGVRFRGNWHDVWRANLELRGAVKVLARIGSFSAMSLGALEKRARDFDWGQFLRRDIPVKVEVTTQKSKIYHQGAAAERIEKILREDVGMAIDPDAAVVLKARIDDNLVTLSIDTSGESLHKRGHKAAVAKAPMRETMAALFLRQMGFDGSQTVFDPMCGSGTFVIEAAEIAAGLRPGRSRTFAFEHLATFDADVWATMRQVSALTAPACQFFGADRDAGAVTSSRANATRAGVADFTDFSQGKAEEIAPPTAAPGIVIVNPPYGSRISNKGHLYGLHSGLGMALKARFSGWRVGIVTTEAGLARATGLPLLEPGPSVSHGGLRVRLFQTDPLP